MKCVLLSAKLKASSTSSVSSELLSSSVVQRKQCTMELTNEKERKWLHLFDTNIKEKFIMKEHFK